MMCEGCATTVENAVRRANKSVKTVSIDLPTGVVTLGLQLQTLQEALGVLPQIMKAIRKEKFEAEAAL